jgi:DnaK suppressor protein
MTNLTDSQRDELAARLTARRQTLRAEVQRELANSDDPRLVGFKNELAATEDWVLADILADLDIAMVTRDIGELGEVEAALSRIADGSYGT